jgi:hypothetical protein
MVAVELTMRQSPFAPAPVATVVTSIHNLSAPAADRSAESGVAA